MSGSSLRRSLGVGDAVTVGLGAMLGAVLAGPGARCRRGLGGRGHRAQPARRAAVGWRCGRTPPPRRSRWRRRRSRGVCSRVPGSSSSPSPGMPGSRLWRRRSPSRAASSRAPCWSRWGSGWGSRGPRWRWRETRTCPDASRGCRGSGVCPGPPSWPSASSCSWSSWWRTCVAPSASPASASCSTTGSPTPARSHCAATGRARRSCRRSVWPALGLAGCVLLAVSLPTAAVLGGSGLLALGLVGWLLTGRRHAAG